MYEIQDLKEQAVNSLLSVLTEGGVITESDAKRIPITAQIITESMDTSEIFNGVQISIWEVFNVWNNFKYRSARDIIGQLFKGKGLEEIPTNRAKERLDRIMEWYAVANKANPSANLPPLPLTTGTRAEEARFALKNGYTNYGEMINAGHYRIDTGRGIAIFAPQEGDFIDYKNGGGRRPAQDDLSAIFGDDYMQDANAIDRGRIGRDNSQAGRTVERINSMELMAGELYTNISRIPRPAAFKWLNLFNRDVERFGLPPDKRYSNKWKKVFIMGYQIEDKLLFEIWFNTIDSTYTLHDFFGNELSRRVPTMNEAVRMLMNAAVKFSKDDVEFFKNPANRSIADSFFKPLISTTDSMMVDMMKRERDLYRKEREEQKKAERDFERRRQEEEAYKINARMDRSAKNQKRKEKVYNFTTTVSRSVLNRVNKPKPDNTKTFTIGRGGASVTVSDSMKNIRDNQARERSELAYRQLKPLEPSATDWNKYSRELRNSIEESAKTLQEDIKFRDLFLRGRVTAEEVSLYKGANILFEDFSEDISLGLPRSRLNAKVFGSSKYRRAFPNSVMKILEEHVEAMYKNMVTESFDFSPESFISDSERLAELGVSFKEDVMNPSFQRSIDNTREQARRDSATFNLIQRTVMGSITKYNDTRLSQNQIKQMISKHLGKHAISGGIYNKIRKFFMGQTDRVDFQIGYTLNDRVFYEIWQITQANPSYDGKRDMRKTFTGLYLFDVTAGIPKLIRGSMPYLRNAEQALLQVLGVVGR